MSRVFLMSSCLNAPCPIEKHHDVSTFDCGYVELNDYLQKYALVSQRASASKTYVATLDNRVIGYYTLAPASVSPEMSPERIVKGLGRQPVPVILLARLAVDLKERKRGLGKGLLKDAMLRAVQGAEIIGGRAILVHAKDDTAASFYTKFGFIPSPIDKFHLYLLMKDIKATLQS